MSMFFNIFGGKKPAAAPTAAPTQAVKPARSGAPQGNNDILSQIAVHNKKVESLEKRMEHLEKKILKCEADAKAKVAKKDQKGALQALQLKKLYTTQVDTLQGSILKLEQQVVAMESASVNTATLTDLDAGNKTMKAQRERAGIDEDTVADIFDSLEEEMQINNSIGDALAGPAQEALDDDDLLAELAELQTESTTVEAAAAAPAAAPTKVTPAANNTAFNLPNAPLPQAPTAQVVEESEEEAELRRIQVEMGM